MNMIVLPLAHLQMLILPLKASKPTCTWPLVTVLCCLNNKVLTVLTTPETAVALVAAVVALLKSLWLLSPRPVVLPVTGMWYCVFASVLMFVLMAVVRSRSCSTF